MALSSALISCGKQGIGVDGTLGPETRKALAALASCPKAESVNLPSNDLSSGKITVALWTRLLPNVEIPGVHARAFVLSLSHEGTDYDVVEWNYNTSDDRSALTWGPFGATVGWGNEVRAILKRVNSVNSKLLPAAFHSEFPTVEKLIESAPAAGYALLRPVGLDRNRRKVWNDAFGVLGSESSVRAEYDSYALNSDEWLQPNLRRLYSLLPGGSGTEIDYAFFLDLAMHMSITDARISKVAAALRNSSALSPARRRQVISRSMVPSTQMTDRLGRNVVYYIDGIGIAGLSDEELTAWRHRTGRRASQCGLDDQHNYPFK
jgi:hypothetical protein